MMTQDIYISTLFKPKKFKKLIDFPSPTWYHVFLTTGMSLILCKQGQFRFKGFRLIIRKLNLFIKRRYFKVQYPSYKRDNSYRYKLYALSILYKMVLFEAISVQFCPSMSSERCEFQ